jgi:flagellar basal-body rod protein FlgB
MLDKLDAEFAFNRQALDVRAYRQELLSSNIANADTPGYQARDVDFSSALARSLQQVGASMPSTGATGSLAMVTTTSGQMTGQGQTLASSGAADGFSAPQYRIPTQPSLDGNTVDLDAERVQFADNSLHYESGMTVITQQIKAMLAAISSGS